jgi:hypothetical protein
MHCYTGQHVWCWYGPGHWFLTSQLRHHRQHCGPGHRFWLFGHYRHDGLCGHNHPVTLAGHGRFGGAAWWPRHHSSVGEHGCAQQTGGAEPTGSHHRPGQPASTTAGGLLNLTITL